MTDRDLDQLCVEEDLVIVRTRSGFKLHLAQAGSRRTLCNRETTPKEFGSLIGNRVDHLCDACRTLRKENS